jgi:hypothetical protein
VVERWDEDSVRLEVRDDGAGFDPQSVTGGVGFTSMRDRLAAMGGDLAIALTPPNHHRARSRRRISREHGASRVPRSDRSGGRDRHPRRVSSLGRPNRAGRDVLELAGHLHAVGLGQEDDSDHRENGAQDDVEGDWQ